MLHFELPDLREDPTCPSLAGLVVTGTGFGHQSRVLCQSCTPGEDPQLSHHSFGNAFLLPEKDSAAGCCAGDFGPSTSQASNSYWILQGVVLTPRWGVPKWSSSMCCQVQDFSTLPPLGLLHCTLLAASMWLEKRKILSRPVTKPQWLSCAFAGPGIRELVTCGGSFQHLPETISYSVSVVESEKRLYQR